MKYLKYKKIFENTNDIISTIEDICLELNHVQVSLSNSTDYQLSIQTSIPYKGYEFTFSDPMVMDVIDRLYEYLGDKITSFSILVKSDSWHTVYNWVKISDYKAYIEYSRGKCNGIKIEFTI